MALGVLLASRCRKHHRERDQQPQPDRVTPGIMVTATHSLITTISGNGTVLYGGNPRT